MIRRMYLLGLCICASLGCNPFSPTLDQESLKDKIVPHSRKSIDGMFGYFKNAYEARDTSLYGLMFSQDFTFSYFDFDANVPISWDRATELNTTYRLFRNTEQITLDWNFYVQKDTTETEASIVRSFNLTIVQNSQSIFTGTGRARFRLRRSSNQDDWQIWYWFDDSDF
jgi:hypothetical protein